MQSDGSSLYGHSPVQHKKDHLLARRPSDSDSGCIDVTESWREDIWEQMCIRNTIQLIPYLDITKANPYVALTDAEEKQQGLTQRLQELQTLMKRNYKAHRRRTLFLLVLSALLFAGLVALAILWPLVGISNASQGAAPTCDSRDFVLSDAESWAVFQESGCTSVRTLTIAGSGEPPVVEQRTPWGSDRRRSGSSASSTSLAFPGVVHASKLNISSVGTQDVPVELSFPDLKSVISLTVDSSYFANFSMPALASVVDSATFTKIMLPSMGLALDALTTCGDMRFEFLRLQYMSFVALQTLRSLAFEHCDVGSAAFPSLQSLGSLIVSESGGWYESGPKQSVPPPPNGPFLPSGWLTPEFGNLVCKEGAGCDGDLKSPDHHSPLHLGDGEDGGGDGDGQYGHNDPLPPQPPSGGRRGAGAVPLSFDMPGMVHMGDVSFIHVSDLWTISMPQAIMVASFSCQWCTFEPESVPAGANRARQAINMPNVTSLGQLVLYMSDNIGALSFPKLTSTMSWKIQYTRDLVGIVVAQEAPPESPFGPIQPEPFGPMQSVTVSMNHDLVQVDMGLIGQVQETVDLDNNPSLTTFVAPGLQGAGTIVLLLNPNLTTVSLRQLTSGNIMIAKNSQLSGTLEMPLLRESGILLFTGNNLTRVSLPLLRQQTAYSGLNSVALWALSLVTDGGVGLDTTKALVMIKDEPLADVTIPALPIAYDVILSDLSSLESLNMTSLAVVSHSLALRSLDKMNAVEFPALYMCGNLTVQNNVGLTSLSIPALQDVSIMSIVGNSNLTSMNASSLRFVDGFNYAVEVVLNNKALCLPPSFNNITAGDCIIGNADVSGLTGQEGNSTVVSCPDCCDSKVLGGGGVCKYVTPGFVQARAFELDLRPPPPSPQSWT